jgi:hypothetical protein
MKVSAMIHLVIGALFMLIPTMSVPIWSDMEMVRVDFGGSNLPNVPGIMENVTDVRVRGFLSLRYFALKIHKY